MRTSAKAAGVRDSTTATPSSPITSTVTHRLSFDLHAENSTLHNMDFSDPPTLPPVGSIVNIEQSAEKRLKVVRHEMGVLRNDANGNYILTYHVIPERAQ